MFETPNLALHIILTLSGVIAIILILKVYTLYQTLKINRTVMTPMLFTGVFIALAGLSEVLESYLGEIGVAVHSVFMLLAAFSFIYGIYGYHEMLKRAVNLQ
jgi:multisubunit Na+/H+ antiporter MnhG subunit